MASDKKQSFICTVSFCHVSSCRWICERATARTLPLSSLSIACIKNCGKSKRHGHKWCIVQFLTLFLPLKVIQIIRMSLGFKRTKALWHSLFSVLHIYIHIVCAFGFQRKHRAHLDRMRYSGHTNAFSLLYAHQDTHTHIAYAHANSYWKWTGRQQTDSHCENSNFAPVATQKSLITRWSVW